MNVNNIYPSIQGEGAMAGAAMVILRLQGCTVGCDFCDTKETWVADSAYQRPTMGEAVGTNPHWADVTPDELVTDILDRYPLYSWVLVTGGEPTEQGELGLLVSALHEAGYKVALETSGTALGHIPDGTGDRIRRYQLEQDMAMAFNYAFDWITVSPKFDFKPVLPEALALANEVKFVIGGEAGLGRVQEWLAANPLPPDCIVSLQPISQSARATRLCVQTIMDNPQWRLSIQIHKYLNLP